MKPVLSNISSRVRQIGPKTLAVLIGAFIFIGISLFLEKMADDNHATHSDHGMWSYYTVSELTRDIGFALGIAFAVIATIEAESREELSKQVAKHIQDIQTAVFNSTYGKDIPKIIIDEINELVFSKNFIRFDQTAHYNMRIIKKSLLGGKSSDDDKEVVDVELISTYSVRNISAVARSFSVILNVEKPPFKDLHEYVSIELVEMRINGSDPEPLDEFVIVETERAKKGRCESRLINPGQEMRVETRARLIKLKTDYEIWKSLYPSLGLRVYVDFPDHAVASGADAIHRLNLSERKVGERRREFKVDGALLPHQGLVIWWCCDPTALESVSPATT